MPCGSGIVSNGLHRTWENVFMGPGCLPSTWLASLEPRQKSEPVGLLRQIGRPVCCQFSAKHEVEQQQQQQLGLCPWVPGCSSVHVWQQNLQKTPRSAAELLKCKPHCF